VFNVKFDTDAIRERLTDAEQAIERDLPNLLELVGVQVLSFVSLDYDTKSRGGTGTDGIAWKPLAASTIAKKSVRGKINEKRKTTKSGKARPGVGSSAIGIDTGLQRASASPGFAAAGGGNVLNVTPRAVTVGFARSYSKYFDAERPLLPERLPAAWEREIEELAVTRLERLLKDRLS
jgi:hypothetical protein